MALEKIYPFPSYVRLAYLDDIANLRDPDLFRYIIEAELQARTQPGSETRRNPTYVAKVVGTRSVLDFVSFSFLNMLTEYTMRIYLLQHGRWYKIHSMALQSTVCPIE